MRADVIREFEAIEAELGLWLDRLETGDYADRDVVAGYLGQLHRVEFNLFMIAALLGHPRPRSTRLGEAIERLLLGCADSVLAELTRRADDALHGQEDPGLAAEAERAGTCVAADYRWSLARRFYEVAQRATPFWKRPQLETRLKDIQLLLDEATEPTGDGDIVVELERNPSVDPVRLPEIWLRLGCRFGARCYFQHPLRAVEAIGATGLHARIKRELVRLNC